MGSLTHMTCRGTWSAAHLVSGDQFPSWTVEAFWREPICGEKTMRRFLWRALPLCSASNPTWLVEPSGEPWKCSRQWDKTKSWGFVMAENPMEPSQQDWGPGLVLPEFSVPRMGEYKFSHGRKGCWGSFPPCVTVLPRRTEEFWAQEAELSAGDSPSLREVESSGPRKVNLQDGEWLTKTTITEDLSATFPRRQ